MPSAARCRQAAICLLLLLVSAPLHAAAAPNATSCDSCQHGGVLSSEPCACDCSATVWTGPTCGVCDVAGVTCEGESQVLDVRTCTCATDLLTIESISIISAAFLAGFVLSLCAISKYRARRLRRRALAEIAEAEATARRVAEHGTAAVVSGIDSAATMASDIEARFAAGTKATIRAGVGAAVHAASGVAAGAALVQELHATRARTPRRQQSTGYYPASSVSGVHMPPWGGPRGSFRGGPRGNFRGGPGMSPHIVPSFMPAVPPVLSARLAAARLNNTSSSGAESTSGRIQSTMVESPRSLQPIISEPDSGAEEH